MVGKVLVVDDMEAQRELCARELHDEGYDVIVAATGEEAVRKVDEAEPDLVVLDMSMPGMDGLEALGRLLKNRPDLPVVISSAYGSYRDSFMTWAAAAYVIKSPDLAELKRTVKAILAERKTA